MSSTEHTYQPGQKVIVVDATMTNDEYRNGDVLTVKRAYDGKLRVEEFESPFLFLSEVQPYQPEAEKDVITIQRSELPEIIKESRFASGAGGSRFNPGESHSEWWHTRALEALAISEFLAAEEEAEKVRKAEEARWAAREADLLWLDKPALIQHIIEQEKAAEKGEAK